VLQAETRRHASRLTLPTTLIWNRPPGALVVSIAPDSPMLAVGYPSKECARMMNGSPIVFDGLDFDFEE
jgi:hypothetical protein